jgi:hypothetical protein
VRRVHDGVAAVERTQGRVAVGDVADGVVGAVDAELCDAGLQPGGVAHQESDRMSGIGNRFRAPSADESGAASDQNPHTAYLLDERTVRCFDASTAGLAASRIASKLAR